MVNWLVEVVDTWIPKQIKTFLKQAIPDIDKKIDTFVKKFFTKDEIKDKKIRRGPLKGRRFLCSLKFEKNYWRGIHDIEVSRFITSHLRKGDIFYDIGSHKGYFSLMAAQLVGSSGKVISFEPNLSNKEMMEKNLLLNPDLAEIIVIKELAISDRSKIERFKGKPHSTMGKLIKESDYVGNDTYNVQAVSLNDFVADGNPGPTFIKMDIEGGEKWALQGMTDVLKKHKPVLVIEIHDSNSFNELKHIARELGYRITTLDGQSIYTEGCFTERSQFVAIPSPS